MLCPSGVGDCYIQFFCRVEVVRVDIVGFGFGSWVFWRGVSVKAGVGVLPVSLGVRVLVQMGLGGAVRDFWEMFLVFFGGVGFVYWGVPCVERLPLYGKWWYVGTWD